MNTQDIITQAHEQGSLVGQIAISEYLMKNYAEHLSREVTMFLQKVLDGNYQQAAVLMEKPAEDLALTVSEIMARAGE